MFVFLRFAQQPVSLFDLCLTVGTIAVAAIATAGMHVAAVIMATLGKDRRRAEHRYQDQEGRIVTGHQATARSRFAIFAMVARLQPVVTWIVGPRLAGSEHACDAGVTRDRLPACRGRGPQRPPWPVPEPVCAGRSS